MGFVSGEKRGKVHELPVHPKAKHAVDTWLANSGLSDHSDWPLFFFRRSREIERHLFAGPISRRSLLQNFLRRFATKARD